MLFQTPPLLGRCQAMTRLDEFVLISVREKPQFQVSTSSNGYPCAWENSATVPVGELGVRVVGAIALPRAPVRLDDVHLGLVLAPDPEGLRELVDADEHNKGLRLLQHLVARHGVNERGQHVDLVPLVQAGRHLACTHTQADGSGNVERLLPSL